MSEFHCVGSDWISLSAGKCQLFACKTHGKRWDRQPWWIIAWSNVRRQWGKFRSGISGVKSPFIGYNLIYAGDTINVEAYGREWVDFVAHFTTSLRDRFPEEDLNLLSCLGKVFNVRNYPNENLNEYAIAEIALLVDYFEHQRSMILE